MLTYFLLWFPMLFIAIDNGALRDLGYKKRLGEAAAHRLSTITLILFFALYIGWAIQKFPPENISKAWLAGLLWLVMTLLLETGMGLKQGKSWRQIAADYDITQGRIWILIPLWVLVAPALFYTIFN
ncbi:hypothetical protein [Pseudocnuella soli]|uniref:hypothetical protein n=1 Tax=Pseudocnuella soli TaxID=2502779 RepID=UPI001052D625|nr:hypothetical protein [Pseudocnuella soli]